MNFNHPFLCNLRNIIVEYLDKQHSQTFPIAFKDL